jgi:hypothetical protein
MHIGQNMIIKAKLINNTNNHYNNVNKNKLNLVRQTYDLYISTHNKH